MWTAGAPSFLWTRAACSLLTSLRVKYCVHSDAKAWALVPKSVFGLHEKKIMNRNEVSSHGAKLCSHTISLFLPF